MLFWECTHMYTHISSELILPIILTRDCNVICLLLLNELLELLRQNIQNVFQSYQMGALLLIGVPVER